MLLEGSKTWKSNAEVAPGGLRNPAYDEFIGFRWEQKKQMHILPRGQELTPLMVKLRRLDANDWGNRNGGMPK